MKLNDKGWTRVKGELMICLEDDWVKWGSVGNLGSCVCVCDCFPVVGTLAGILGIGDLAGFVLPMFVSAFIDKVSTDGHIK